MRQNVTYSVILIAVDYTHLIIKTGLIMLLRLKLGARGISAWGIIFLFLPTLAVSATQSQKDIYGVESNSFKIHLLETMTVTGIRESARLADTAASIGILDQDELKALNATHAADVLNRIPGVYIAQLGSTGQGVAAAIRQPISYGPVYLYLENGVPTRSPAFFNHNALYEINVAQADSIEVTKGPGSALYGSDAIGGVINVISNAPIEVDAVSLGIEGGDFSWRRVQLDASGVGSDHAVSVRSDWVESDGWRENTAFDRQSLTLVWQTEIAGFDVNTVYSGGAINMKTGGSGLTFEDYKSSPEKAGNLVGYRDVSAHRISSAWEKSFTSSHLSITPYFRQNDLEYVATWALNTGREKFIPWLGRSQLDSSNAHINESGHSSAGLQLKYKKDLPEFGELSDAFWIVGLDYDYSRGFTEQTYIERTDQDLGDYWLEYRKAGLLYDYEVDFIALSPYVHVETGIGDRWRLSAGLRYDKIEYDYKNNLGIDLNSRTHKRPADTQVNMDHFSPKIGLIYDVSKSHNAYASYRHAFRIPSSGQLFRSGSTVDSTELDPVTVDSFEVGIRGQLLDNLSYEMSIYQMLKKDDILGFTDETGARRNSNAGETEHRGIELGLGWNLTENLLLQASYTHARHTYKEWVDRSGDFSGNDMPSAPREFGSVVLAYHPAILQGGRLEVEWSHRGEQFIDESNELIYEGHDLINFRSSFNFSEHAEIYANLLNMSNERYADTVSKWGPKYTPGRPRSIFAGVKLHF